MSDAKAGMLVEESAQSAGPDAAAAQEEDQPNARVIVIAVIAILTIVTILIFGLVELFSWNLQAEIRRKQLEPVSSLLREVRAEEQAKLNRYQWIDDKAGIVRIPLSRAKQLVLSDYAPVGPEGASSADLPRAPVGVGPAANEHAPADGAKAGASKAPLGGPVPAAERSR